MDNAILFLATFLITSAVFATPIIPSGNISNILYYKIGGGSDYALPPVQETNTINLGAGADLSLGNQCGMFNPALSIQNTMNNMKDNLNNLPQNIIGNATGSIMQMPMYFLAQANPTMYNMLNNALVNANIKIATSVKSCEQIKNQIAQGKNPYQEWATISIGDSWKKHLSLIGVGREDINDAKKEIDQHGGEDGVAWVQGIKSTFDNSLRAGGKGQPPLHVIADTVKAGYNAMLNRDLNGTDNAPFGSGLFNQFPSPKDAAGWIINVIGDQIITTCTDSSCTHAEGGSIGRGLLPLATVCNEINKNDCLGTIYIKLQQLVRGDLPIIKENLLAVSAVDLVISPVVIETLKNMDVSQQDIFINKLAQEVAVQRLLDKAFVARDILKIGMQIPVIANNEPAQKILQKIRINLDQHIQAIRFESEIRKQMMSNTLSALLQHSNMQQAQAMSVGVVSSAQTMLKNSAVASKLK